MSLQPNRTALLQFTLQIADNALILGHRLSEWCGHGPVLEQDIAMTNISLDHIGRARSLYQYAAEQYNALPEAERNSFFTSPMLERSADAAGEDDLAFLRDAWDFRNVLLAEQPNGDWAATVARSFFLDAFNYYFFTALSTSSNETLAAVAAKSLKETAYHLRWSSEWVIRLGDGTEESHKKMQAAVNELWAYTGELFSASPADLAFQQAENGFSLDRIRAQWQEHILPVIGEATLTHPESGWFQDGGKQGTHSEHLGYMLAEMQFMQRTYPGMEW